MVKYHGVLKKANHGIPYIYHTQYMNKPGLPQFTIYSRCLQFDWVFSRNENSW